tara:strand:- start:430 stop:699 length:270 start_codon:yes stop_codon:yes gene_type:complete
MEKRPFVEENIGGLLKRTFNSDTPNHELVWHRDLEDREITVVESNGWGYQLDNELPLPLIEEQKLFIPKMMWHRVIKGDGKLVVNIKKL